LPETFFDSSRKNCYANLQNYSAGLPDSPHPVIISKNPDFGHFISLARKEFRFSFSKYKKIFFGCWLLPEKLAFARKMMVLPESGGLQPPSPWLVQL